MNVFGRKCLQLSGHEIIIAVNARNLAMKSQSSPFHNYEAIEISQAIVGARSLTMNCDWLVVISCTSREISPVLVVWTPKALSQVFSIRFRLEKSFQ